MARIAIIGPGAVGGVIAGWLEHTGKHELLLCARRALPEFVVETSAGSARLQARVLSAPPAPASLPMDWVLVTTKAYDAAGAAAWFPALVGQDTRVAILQNGVEHRERFAPWLPPAKIVPVIVDCPAERPTPTHVRQRGTGLLTVENDAAGQAFAALFAGTALEAKLTEDLKSAAWRKLCINAAGVVSALTLQPNRVMHDPAIAETARAIVRECIAVGRAEGAMLDDGISESVIEGCRRAPADGVNSLLADRLAGRPTEIDARNGVIVRFGRRHGIPTPCNQMAVALIEAMSRAAQAP